MAASEDQSPPPAMLPEYDLLDCIGAGGMGSVYKARHKVLGTLAAVKFLPIDRIHDPDAVARFQREASSLAALTHPHIVKVLSVCRSENYLALAMEYLNGVPLSELLLREGRLSIDAASPLFIQILDALACAHSQGIIHRDLKPSNILILGTAPKRSAKLIDFGLARKEDSTGQKVTQTGALLGTPRYMSPEQCMGQPVDARSDLYSVGCIMYECLEGKPLADGETAIEVMLKHVHEGVPVCDTEKFGTLAGVVQKALAKNPLHRFQSAEEFNAAILSGGMPATKARPTLPKLNMSSIACGAAALCVMAMVGFYLSTRQPHQETPQSKTGVPANVLLAELTEKVKSNQPITSELEDAVSKSNEVDIGDYNASNDFAERFLRAFGATGDIHYLRLAAAKYATALRQSHAEHNLPMMEAKQEASILQALGDAKGAERVWQEELAYDGNASMKIAAFFRMNLIRAAEAAQDFPVVAEQTRWLDEHTKDIDQALPLDESDEWKKKYGSKLPKLHWRVMEEYVPPVKLGNIRPIREQWALYQQSQS